MRITILMASLTLPLVLAMPAAAADQDAPNAVDQQFVSQAIGAGNDEIAAAQLEQHSNNPGVVVFATRMLHDHPPLNAELIAIAKHLNLPYPSPPPAPPRTAATLIVPRAYMAQQVQAHQQAIALFKGEAQNGGVQQLRTLAAQALPILQTHLDMAQQFMQTGTIAEPPGKPAPPAPPSRTRL